MAKYIICLFFLLTGCAFPGYHFDTQDEWVSRKEAAFVSASTPWQPSYNNKQLVVPFYAAKYLGYDGKNITFDNLQRLDYFHGYIYARQKPKFSLLKLLPIGIFSFESFGVIGSEKEFYSRPTIEAFLFQIGFMAASSVGGIGFMAPTRVWEEECFHASQEILHPRFTEISSKIMYWATLQPVPIVHEILASALYYIHPMEIDAKIKKWVYFGFVFNLDCDAAWYRYQGLLLFVATRRCQVENVKYTSFQAVAAYAALLSGEEINNPVFNMAKRYQGIIVRLPYEQKLVYAPWVPGVMREKKELPWFSRNVLGVKNEIH